MDVFPKHWILVSSNAVEDGVSTIFKTIPGAERGKLGFRHKAKKHFNFLLIEYGYRCVDEDVTYIRFESEDVFVNLFHGRSSYEVGIEIGLLGDVNQSERKVTINELQEFFGRREDNLFPCQATTPETIDKCLSNLATFLRREGEPVLQGDCSTFRALFRIQKELSSKFLDDIKLRRTRARATDAWQARDYLEVVRLFEPVRDRLTPAELGKLEYAKKRSIDDSC